MFGATRGSSSFGDAFWGLKKKAIGLLSHYSNVIIATKEKEKKDSLYMNGQNGEVVNERQCE